MTLRSSTGPSTSVAVVGRSAGKDRGADAAVSSTGAPPSIVSRIPAPSRMVRVRSTPGKLENGPAFVTRAMLTRQSNVASPAPSGETAISVVSPPPFFHGMRRYSRARITRIRLVHRQGITARRRRRSP